MKLYRHAPAGSMTSKKSNDRLSDARGLTPFSTIRLQHAGLVLLAATVLAAATGCGSSAEPANWEEADASGIVEANYIESCQLANSELPENDARAANVEDLCRCSYNGLRDVLDFDEFKELDTALRVTPDPGKLTEISNDSTRESWRKAKNAIGNCVSKASAATPGTDPAETTARAPAPAEDTPVQTRP